MNMREISVAIHGLELDYDTSRDMASIMAKKNNPDASLMAWCEKKSGLHSPSSVQCDGEFIAGWEEYGRNHGGRLKILLNDGDYVFIYS